MLVPMNPSPDDVKAAMSDHVFFGGLRPEEQERVVALGRIASAAEGTILFQTGDAYRGFYLLLSGTVQIYRLNEAGRMLVLHVIERGESFAEVPLFEPTSSHTYPATAETLDDCTFLFIPSAAFLDFVDAHPRVCLGMLGEVTRRLREAVRQLDALSLQDVRERLARHLCDTASTRRNPPTVDLNVPKSVLAAELGTVPETLSRALRDLEDDGLIQRRGDRIDVTDPDALARLVRSS